MINFRKIHLKFDKKKNRCICGADLIGIDLRRAVVQDVHLRERFYLALSQVIGPRND